MPLDEIYRYKQQDGEFILVGGESRQVESPFLETGRYKVDWQSERRTKTVTMTLAITDLETVDVGNYKCSVGYDGEEKTESEILEMHVTPTLPVEELKFDVKADNSDGSVMLLNVPTWITCSAASVTRSSELSLAIKLEDNTDITQSFTPQSRREWIGEDGLKMPKVTFNLESEWMPEQPGEGSISCIYQDGERQLAIQTSNYRRDATTSMTCSSNRLQPVKYDDLSITINCEVHDYPGSMSDLKGTWSFLYENELVQLEAGNSEALRTAKQSGTTYTLFISRVTDDMLKYGSVFNYSIVVTRKDNGKEITKGSYGLRTDTTRKLTSGATSSFNSNGVILLGMIMLILRLL
ncbi:uncharacterized protein [Watersipora subatra]|uniref:uncharacterized protein n=1 Tax=Watersipora subatra TaxID=2589382 RepID=UPI00355B7EE2